MHKMACEQAVLFGGLSNNISQSMSTKLYRRVVHNISRSMSIKLYFRGLSDIY